MLPPAVIVHGLFDARTALAPRLPVTLVSAPGASLYAGCGWWTALVRRVHVEFPEVPVTDILDCGDGSGQALAALRIGQSTLVLASTAPGWDEVAAIAATQGGMLLAAAPDALDLATRGTARRLADWLQGRTIRGDSTPAVRQYLDT